VSKEATDEPAENGDGADNVVATGDTVHSAELTSYTPSVTGTIGLPKHATPAQHVVVWLIGVVLASLIPFLFIYLHGVDKGGTPGLAELLSRGDLLLIALVICIAGITEQVLILNRIEQRRLMGLALLLLGCILLIVAEAFWYADITASVLDGRRVIESDFVAVGSTMLFLASAFTSSMSVKIAAGVR
jgi:energy-converting hydrogenase Eha subunit C